MKTINLTIGEELWARVVSKAALQSQTRSQATAEALMEWVERPARPLPPRTDEWLDQLRACGAKGTQAANSIMRARIASREQLDATSDEELLRLRNFGQGQLLLMYQIGWRP